MSSAPTTEPRGGAWIVLGALPLAFLVLTLIFRYHALPFWLWFNVDPSYFYLLNGLTILNGETPADVFHPGTPVQSLVALVIGLSHPFTAGAGINALVLADPERYLKIASTVIVWLDGAALYLLGLAAFAAFGSLLPALVAQTAPFATLFLIKHAYQVKPEPLLLLAATLMAALMLAAARQGIAAKPKRYTLGFAACAGLGIAAKLHFLPIALAPLFLLARPRWVALYGVAVVGFFLIFVAPALANWSVSVAYFAKMAVGSGAYGSGEASFVAWSKYPANLAKVFAGKPVFDVVLLLALGALVWQMRRVRRGIDRWTPAWAALAGLTLAQIAQALLVAKYPIAYYMIPAVALTGAQAALVLVLGERLSGWWPHWRQTWIVLLVAVAGLRILSFIQDLSERADWKRNARAIDMQSYAACAKVYFDFASNPSYALFMGDMMAGWRWGSALKAQAKSADEYFMNFFTGHLKRWDERVELADVVARYPCVVFRGVWQREMRNEIGKLAGNRQPDAACGRPEQEYLLVLNGSCVNPASGGAATATGRGFGGPNPR
ncbi:MAG: hypothetical protein HZC25_14380 [Rhodospirillales bacterium]|nr:hypothetical protein [Rhodospirillales bacterium]